MRIFRLGLLLFFGLTGLYAQAQSDTLQTESGLTIIFLDKREGNPPNPGEKLQLHYISKLEDGRVIETSIHEKPFKFKYQETKTLPAWTEALGYMTVGDRVIVHAPAELALGSKSIPLPPDAIDGDGNKLEGYLVPPNSPLVFKLWLMSIE